MIIGASEEISKVLEEEDDNLNYFFGESEGSVTSSCTRSLSGSESDEPPAKRPQVEDSWVKLEGDKVTKTSAAEECDTIQMLRNPSDATGSSSSSLPGVLPEAGLSAQRCKYLQDNVPGFGHPENKVA